MSNAYHTPIVTGQAANAANINAPLGELDASISYIADRMAVVENSVLLGGAALTQANGTAAAGQKAVTVDTSGIFAAGCGVEYQLAGGGLEYNTVANVNSPTQITLSENIGTGGIADNAVLSVVPVGLFNLLGDPTNALEVTRTANNEAALVNGALRGASLFAHAFADNTDFASTGTGAYCSFDARPEMTGSTAYNHLYGFEARMIFSGSGGLDNMMGFVVLPTVNAALGHLTGFSVSDPAGTGEIDALIGLAIDALTRGEVNWAIYTEGTTPSHFGGAVEVGSLSASGSVTGSNLRFYSDSLDAEVGIGTPGAAVGFLTALGHNAAHSTTGYKVTAVGAAAGYTNSTGANNTFLGGYAGYGGNGSHNTVVGMEAGYTGGGSSNVFVGRGAGYYETGSSRLIIDNDTRWNENDARAKALIYGVFAAESNAPDNQEIRFNVGKMGFFGAAPAAKPTGVAVTAAGIHAALVALNLIAS